MVPIGEGYEFIFFRRPFTRLSRVVWVWMAPLPSRRLRSLSCRPFSVVPSRLEPAFDLVRLLPAAPVASADLVAVSDAMNVGRGMDVSVGGCCQG